jgi:inner membrane protein yedI
MAFANLLTLIDDIASLLDDVAVLTKTAGAKTAGVLGDDLALNAQQVSGVRVDRELPVVWAVFKGSLLNKSILVPLALAISAFAPWLVTPLLTVGGLFLCFEGAEKLLHAMLHGKSEEHGQTGHTEAPLDEKARIKGAIRTDFILSAEIIAITLGTVQGEPLATQVTVMALIALAMTVGVYGVVAAIVKLDDLGLYLSQLQGGGLKAPLRAIGRGILRAAPWLMKGLSVAGTIAMFLVGGGIVVHGFPWLHHQIEHLVAPLQALTQVPAWLTGLATPVAQGVAGLLAGTVLALVFMGVQKLRGADAH